MRKVIGLVLLATLACTPDLDRLDRPPSFTPEPLASVPSASVPPDTPEPSRVKTKSPKKVIFVYAPNLDKSWGLDQVISDWNKAKYTRLVETDAKCKSTVACVTITVGYFSPNHVGRTKFGVEQWQNTITLDPSAEFHQPTVCHELGHILGLGHITNSTRTCMGMWDIPSPKTATAFDICWLNQHGRWDLEKAYYSSHETVDAQTVRC